MFVFQEERNKRQRRRLQRLFCKYVYKTQQIWNAATSLAALYFHLIISRSLAEFNNAINFIKSVMLCI